MADLRADAAFRRSINTQKGPCGTTRVETDSLGSREIPGEAYWGINVLRALENFAISGRPIATYPDLIFGYACVKQAAARANAEIGVLAADKAALIDRVCEEIKDGQLHDQFVVDIMQGGAGTSTNMNVNEVIANRGLELAGFPKGSYEHLHPNDHVNRSQSTNDTYPTALKVGLGLAIERLLAELKQLEDAFRAKGREFARIVKVGRTQLQDAVPMTLGQEFEGFAVTLADDRASFERVFVELGEINLGATAIGTGITADQRYAAAVQKHLAAITGFPIVTASNLIEATTDVGVFMELSGVLKRNAMKLSKICNDLRLLSSGPQAGFGEINLPPRQAGSSIMPGKVNPVIPEVVNEVAFIVAGGDVTLAMAAEAGQLQLNAFEPVMAHVLFENLKWMTAAMTTLRENCVLGITANQERLAKQVASFVGVITALIPEIGYEAAAKLAKEALSTNANIADLVVSSGQITREKVTELLSPERLTSN
ncbi:MAG TPA: aspartate ammonia-lyase [Verrucomicrobiota bacterium]|nr:aspartate ammonia-lyase [Verrucomicrobiales bacterium]HRI14234.1 aspartate ammonia-lyase [Verrucomicrobiota bacterium]